MKPKASIIIPMFNAEKLISETLHALENQTEKNFEIIIVNDGSTDNSEKIVKDFKSNLRIKVINQSNQGPAAARNNGAKNAKSEIIIFTDSDCIPREDFVEKILFIFNNPEISGVVGEYETKNKDSLAARYFGYESYYRHEPMKNKKIDHMATYACAYRKKDFGEGFLNVFKKANMEDTELSYRLAKEGKILIFSPEVVVKHPHPGTVLKFLKQQYGRGYWRVPGHTKHPDKLVKDSYLGRAMLVQGGLSVLFFIAILSLFFFSIWKIVIILPLLSFLLLYLSNLGFGIYCYKYEKKMFFVAPLIASLRSIAGTLGFLRGILDFRIINRVR